MKGKDVGSNRTTNRDCSIVQKGLIKVMYTFSMSKKNFCIGILVIGWIFILLVRDYSSLQVTSLKGLTMY